MTNEEFEQEIKRLEERIEDQINSLRIKFLESNANKKPYEVEVPEDIGDYVYINNIGNIYDLNTFTIVEYEKIYKRGLAFKSKEEAEQFDKERILINKLKNWAKEQQGDWTPNWNDDDETIHEVQIDRFPMYACDSPLVINEVEEVRSVSIFPYFCTYETARKFIEEFGDEIKEVFC
jgi:hypothetical protein